MKHLPITLKFLCVMLLLGVFVVAVALYSAVSMGRIDAGYQADIKGVAAAERTLSHANRMLVSERYDMADLQLESSVSGSQAMAALLRSDAADFDASMVKAAALSPKFAAPTEALAQRAQQLVRGDCQDAVPLPQDGAAQVAAARAVFLSQCSPKFPAVVLAVRRLQNQALAAQAADVAQLSANTVMTQWLTVAGVCGGLVVVVAVGMMAMRAWVVRPVRDLQGVMVRLAGGNLEVAVTGGERRDEIGGMARAVQIFKDAGLEKRRLEEAARAQAAQAATERAAVEAERASQAKLQAEVVSALGEGLERLAQGALSFRLTKAFSVGYDKLRTDFNGAMARLQETIGAVSVNTQAVGAGASQINAASDDLARRTEQQAASLEQTAAALGEITATVKRSAGGAKEARDVVAAAKSEAEHSGAVVRDAIAAMSQIETSSHEIGSIIGVIDEIAFQTNLLALNAGVEAARAGDAGRGFAVVATEVRALAQRSADAAKQIKALISTSSAQVANGVTLVAETGAALERIVVQVDQLNLLVSQIAGSMAEQATGLGEINTAVGQMDQVTQRNAAMVEEVTAAGHSLREEAAKLDRLVGQFALAGRELEPV